MVNLGGKYEFTLEPNGTLKINENKDYFAEFFDRDKGNSKLVNVTALVGQNGAGKSVLLNHILSELTLYNSTPHQMLAVLHNVESGELIIVHSLSDINYEQVKDKINKKITVIQKPFRLPRELITEIFLKIYQLYIFLTFSMHLFLVKIWRERRILN